jgi:hypothetical protein
VCRRFIFDVRKQIRWRASGGGRRVQLVRHALPALYFCNIVHRYSETQGDGLIMQFRVQSTLHRCQTKFQQVELLQTEAFGRCLVLDGQMQSSQLDEAM